MFRRKQKLNYSEHMKQMKKRIERNQVISLESTLIIRSKTESIKIKNQKEGDHHDCLARKKKNEFSQYCDLPFSKQYKRKLTQIHNNLKIKNKSKRKSDNNKVRLLRNRWKKGKQFTIYVNNFLNQTKSNPIHDDQPSIKESLKINSQPKILRDFRNSTTSYQSSDCLQIYKKVQKNSPAMTFDSIKISPEKGLPYGKENYRKDSYKQRCFERTWSAASFHKKSHQSRGSYSHKNMQQRKQYLKCCTNENAYPTFFGSFKINKCF